ncbi:interferon gamma receptor 1 [Dendrobates tinctorius]|uniref:interferon gamma receptor 1 n=1 Tax=Dendrobates tinctorius TaxID=92724 RepID=UPI003CC97662
MDAILATSLPVLLLAALTALAAGARPTSGPMPVQKPFILQKKSYNFNSTLYWDYNVTSVTPYFQVEYKYYKNSWTIVETCQNISHNYCDLSGEIVEPFFHYDVRVKALVGSEMSDYEKIEFSLIDDGIIGPPKMNASVNGKFLSIDIWYPDVPHVDGKQNIGDYLEDLKYEIYYGKEMEETEDCDYFGCSIDLLIQNQSRVCFSAQGKSSGVPMTIERSKEVCINTTVISGTSKNLQAAIISIVFVVIVIVILSIFIIKRKIKAKSVLPKSLSTFAKAMTTQRYLPSDQTTKYDQVSVSPADSPEEKMTPEEADKPLPVSDDSDNREGSDHGYHSSVGESDQRADEDQNELEESSSRNYYRTENSDSSIECVTEADVPRPEPLRDVRPVGNSFGYDKPHCPL